ncbi:hypothetical protein METBIDRAFT_36082 [Metschnikowia bicuspidata var. bicuspidata NRRL YB-4993]|uniref:SH3 domain-containing protein n=1 Tax=Metschnikowia bicuspidata var. bicuspidata NRRL YB-4993 TaxID=869754 RepID=A0A1A0HJ95_9ASCO|nr:hypothetical protein METBIDRAFT_36082 [Metschnikowia bicuspidata var. bicuspidata NRRL YB-4993]OBA24071.1 hypothetical protein METBIDRAFT_36082 [Metschnikowia bicuspidata var. bicuspidata NRRL YB-4993]
MPLISPRFPAVLSRKTNSAEEADHELFSAFAHDVAQCVEAVEFLAAQNDRILAKYWPALCQDNAAVAMLFGDLVGEHSLEFKGMDTLYASYEVAAYSKMAAVLEDEARALWEPFVRLSTSKIHTLLVHLKHIQGRLKLCDSLHAKCVALEKLVLKLEKKLLADSDGTKVNDTQIADARAALALASARYAALNAKLRATLPESMLLIEEFVSTLVNWTLCRHREVAQNFARKSHALCQFYGLLDRQTNTTMQIPVSIVEQWEAEATPTRLRIESLLLAVHSKNPELLNEEIQGKDSSLRITKTWLKITLKVKDKHHQVKPADRAAGIFHVHQTADPLRSYIQFRRKDAALLKAYPVSDSAQKSLPQTPVLCKTPPPLPPRDETGLVRIKPPPIVHTRESPSSPSNAADTLSPLISTSFTFDEEDTRMSLVGILTTENLYSDIVTEKLIKLYNAQRNEITEAPISPRASMLAVDTWDYALADQADVNDSETMKLIKIQRFYDTIMACHLPVQVVTAEESYAGEEPGDLSFEAGEKVEVLFDLQLNIMTYNKGGDNWVLGAVPSSTDGGARMGFAPKTYF